MTHEPPRIISGQDIVESITDSPSRAHLETIITKMIERAWSTHALVQFNHKGVRVTVAEDSDPALIESTIAQVVLRQENPDVKQEVEPYPAIFFDDTKSAPFYLNEDGAPWRAYQLQEQGWLLYHNDTGELLTCWFAVPSEWIAKNDVTGLTIVVPEHEFSRAFTSE